MAQSTALITFMLQVPPDAFSVELLGSWDNFNRAYHLQRDRKAGEGLWRGCHRFDSITCDGSSPDGQSKREGALKMGCTYWYYYRLNGDAEYHDPQEPSTTICPFLPGQCVNVLDVPTQQVMQSPNASSESLDELVFTLDPKDKYVPLGVRRAATTSAIQERKERLRKEQDGFDFASHVVSPPSSHDREGLSMQRPRSLHSMFSKLRRTKSTESGMIHRNTERATTSWSRKLLSRAGSSRGQTKRNKSVEDVPAVPKIPQDILDMMSPKESSSGNGSPSYSFDRTTERLACLSIESKAETDPLGLKDDAQPGPFAFTPRHQPTHSLGSAFQSHSRHVSCAESSTFSYSTGEDWSPALGANTPSGRMSPVHLPQPDTPHFKGIDDDDKAWQYDFESETHRFDYHTPSPSAPARAPPPPPPSMTPPPLPSWSRNFQPYSSNASIDGFQGYSLPLDDQSSTTTLKKRPSHYEDSEMTGEGERKSSNLRVTSFMGLVEDMGYLGELIN